MKKITIASDVLKPALKKLGQAVSAKTVLPALSNIYCKAGKDEVELITTDLEITISVKCVAEIESGPFELLLPFDFIHSIIGLTKSEPIVIEHPSSRKAKIVTDSDNFEINSLDKYEDYPKIPSVPKGTSLKTTGEFVGLLHKALLSISHDDLRPAMTHACLDVKKEHSFLVTTDSHTLFRYRLPLGAKDPDQLLFSPKVASALKGLNEIEISWSDKMIAMKGDKIIVWARRFDGKFPNYNVVIPKDSPANLATNKFDLIDALNKTSLTSDASKTTSIKLKNGNGHISLESIDPDFERKISVKLPATYDGTVDEFRINARKLLTVMDQVDGDNIKLHIQDSNKAVLISAEGNEDYLGLIMPLML